MDDAGKWFHQQLVRRAGLGRAFSMVIAESERRGTDPNGVVGALVDVLRSYAGHRGVTIDEVVRLVREWRAGQPSENT
jgi:hypothetical protein